MFKTFYSREIHSKLPTQILSAKTTHQLISHFFRNSRNVACSTIHRFSQNLTSFTFLPIKQNVLLLFARIQKSTIDNLVCFKSLRFERTVANAQWDESDQYWA